MFLMKIIRWFDGRHPWSYANTLRLQYGRTKIQPRLPENPTKFKLSQAMETVATNLIGQKEYPAVSIVIPTHPRYPDFKLDRKHMTELLLNVENQLTPRFGKQLAHSIMDKLKRTTDDINYGHLSSGLAIYVSPHHAKVVHLPFEVTEKVIVDDTFEIRDLIYSAKLNMEYLLVMITKNGVRTALGYGNAIVPVTYKGMPDNIADVTNSHSLPGWDYLDTEAYDEKNIHNFIRFIDDVIAREATLSKLPTIVIGDVKLLGYMRSITTKASNIIGYIEGNYEHASSAEIRKKIEPILSKVNEEAEDRSLRILAGAVGTDHYVSGIAQVWRAAEEGRGRLLLVERDYMHPATLSEDGFSLVLDEVVAGSMRHIEDAVDDVIESIIQKGGDIQFVRNGRLDAYERIALVTRS